jgi:hypothetical protein
MSGADLIWRTHRAVVHLVEAGRVPRPQSLTVLYADTRLELPNLQAILIGQIFLPRDFMKIVDWSPLSFRASRYG